jgi:hypothetical protein
MRNTRRVAAAGVAALAVAGLSPAAAAAPLRAAAPAVASPATGPAAAAAGSAASASASPAAGRAHGPAARVIGLPAGFRPEGITSRGRTFYTGSLADGRIWAGDLRTGRGGVLLPGQPGRQLRGMQVDRRTGLLWVAGNEGPTGIVLAVDARTGQVERRYVVEGAQFLNDLVVTRRAVWVTDSRVDRLTRIPLRRSGAPAGGDVRQLAITGQWPATGNIRANGIRRLPDGTLVVVHSAAGLFTISPRTGQARRLPVQGGPGITAGDGLELRGSQLYVVRGSGQNEVSVVRLRRSGGDSTAIWKGALTDPALDVPSTATFARGRLWAVNARFGVPSPDTAAYTVVGLNPRAS